MRCLVKSSGSLASPLAHYLNQPSFLTDEVRCEDSETADLHNPCTTVVMENTFRAERSMVLDHIYYRSATSEDIEEEDRRKEIRDLYYILRPTFPFVSRRVSQMHEDCAQNCSPW